jgi:hypothetical protein
LLLIFISASLIGEIELTRKLTLVLELLCQWSCNSIEALCEIVPQVHLDMLHRPFWMECHLWKGGNRTFLYQNGACTSWYESISLSISIYMFVGASLYCLYHWGILVYDYQILHLSPLSYCSIFCLECLNHMALYLNLFIGIFSLVFFFFFFTSVWHWCSWNLI